MRELVNEVVAGGRSFRGADLRGADLRGADLRGVDFSDVRTGLPPAWAALLLAGALVMSLAIGVAAGFSGRVIARLLASADPRQHAMAIFVIGALVLFVVVAAVKGLRRAIVVVLPLSAVVVLGVGLVAIAMGLGTGRGALGVAAFLLLACALIALGAFARAMAGTVAQWAFFIVAVCGALLGGALGGGVLSAIVAIAALLVGQGVVRGRHGSPWLSRTVLRVACARGTRFEGADLRGAVFDHAKLRAADFRHARLDGARFDHARVQVCLFDDGPPPPLDAALGGSAGRPARAPG